MSKTIIVGGFGPGISKAVAEKFGAEGFAVALVARNAERLAAGAAELAKKGVKSAAFPCDLGDAAAVKAMVGAVRDKLGPIGIVQWTAYSDVAGDLLNVDTASLHQGFDVAVTGLLSAVREARADLKSNKGAILVTNGGLGMADPRIDAMAVQWNAMGLALANAAKHKLVGLLAAKLEPENIYVGEVMVLGAVKGTVFDQGNATIEAATVANKFWDIYSARRERTVNVG
jgi:NAD(P)-dependent dehydrogenase (short-subunit alcohol dehydrogenase family)